MGFSSARAQGTAFTYQGRLTDNSGALTGNYDFTFRLFDAATGGSNQGGPLTNSNVTLSDGLFTVTLDFGVNPFSNGAARWVEIAMRTNGPGSFAALSPRQAVTAAPYAITAGNLTGLVANGNLAGTYNSALDLTNPSNRFTGAVFGDGGGLTNVNAVSLGGLASSNLWQTVGNTASPGQFIGTLNNQPLEFRVNGAKSLRIEPNTNGAPNVIGGSANNVVAPGIAGAFIGGGGATNFPFFLPSHTNTVSSDFGTIVGGLDQVIADNSMFAFLGGGRANALKNGSRASVISGGEQNTTSNAQWSIIGGGLLNSIQGTSVEDATIGGGFGNVLLSQIDAFIGGGAINKIGGTNLSGSISFPLAPDTENVVAGGAANLITEGSSASFIGGGAANTISNAAYAAVPGGRDNLAAADYSFAAGFRAKALHDGTFVWADSPSFNGADFASTSSNQFLIRASGGVGINKNNPATALDVVGTVKATTFSGSGAGLTAVALVDGGNAFTGNQTIISGNLGIGTASPGTALHVRAGGDTELAIESSDAGGHRWTVQSTSINGDANRDGSFQIVDRTLNVSRFLIGTNGNLGIGTVAPAGKLHVNGTAGNNTGVWSNFSDRRLKQHIEPMAAGSLDQLLRLKGVTYEYTRPELREGYDGPHRGWIAQQVEQVFPEWVSEAPDGMKMVTPVGFNALTVEALRELRAEKDAAMETLNGRLEQQLNAQQAELQARDVRIAELEQRLASLEQIIRRAVK